MVGSFFFITCINIHTPTPLYAGVIENSTHLLLRFFSVCSVITPLRMGFLLPVLEFKMTNPLTTRSMKGQQHSLFRPASCAQGNVPVTGHLTTDPPPGTLAGAEWIETCIEIAVFPVLPKERAALLRLIRKSGKRPRADLKKRAGKKRALSQRSRQGSSFSTRNF